jgi:hypothetical protein
MPIDTFYIIVIDFPLLLQYFENGKIITFCGVAKHLQTQIFYVILHNNPHIVVIVY